VVVNGVESGSAAEEAGIQPGDVIVELNRKPVRSTDDFRRLSKSLGKDESTLLLVVRQSRKLFVAINP
jgi:serine protease Do